MEIDLKTFKELGDLVTFSLSQKTGLKKVNLGKYKNLKGIDNIDFLIDSYAVRHSFKKHGVNSKSHLPICVFDIMYLPQILRSGKVVRTDTDVIVVSKNNFGIIGEIVFEFIKNKRGDKYHLKTMYNKRRT